MAKKVIIIGAGFAGLGAAQELRKRDADLEVTILEGGQRVGGRANTRDVEGLGRVEFGATYFHGLNGHPLYGAALKAGLMDDVKSKELRWGFAREGQEELLSTDQADKVQVALQRFAQAVEGCVQAGEKQQQLAQTNGHRRGYNIGQHLQATLMQEVEGFDAESAQATLTAWRWHELQLRINTAAPSSQDISTSWWGDYEELAGPNLPISCGFQAIAEKGADGLNILYGNVVERIEWGQQGVQISCTNGDSYQADAVIVTVSLGVLKANHKSLFHPPLPPAKVAAIGSLGFGLCEKIFARFPVDTPADKQQPRMHEQPCVSHQLLWDVPFPDHPQAGVAHYQMCVYTASAAGSALMNGHESSTSGPSYSNSSNGNGASAGVQAKGNAHAGQVPWWATGMFSFRFGGSEFKPSRSQERQGIEGTEQPPSFPKTKYTGQDGQIFGNSSGEVAHVAARHTPRGLPSTPESQECACLWLAGAHARAMDNASDHEVATGVSQVLSAFPTIALGHAHMQTVPKIWRSHWGLDPLFLGSYSYMSGETSQQAVEELAAAVDEKLYFAGEAMTSKYMGTMHGAYLTGQQAAACLLQNLEV